MNNPSQFQAAITEKVKHKGSIPRLRPVKAIFSELDSYSTAAIINLVNGLDKRGR